MVERIIKRLLPQHGTNLKTFYFIQRVSAHTLINTMILETPAWLCLGNWHDKHS